MYKYFGILLLIVLQGNSLLCFSQKNTDLTYLKFSVEDSPEWTNLFQRSSGWFGGDGIYSIPLNGVEKARKGKTLFIFSDTMVGDIKNGELQPGSTMVHNSIAYLKGGDPRESNFEFLWNKANDGKPTSLFVPKTPATKPGDYFWLGDGFVNHDMNNSIYIFGYRVKNTSDKPFGFAEVGNVIIKIPANSKLPFENQKQIDTPFFLESDGQNGSFGAGIFVNTKKAGVPNGDGYIYVYGVKGKAKEVLVARVLPAEFEIFDKWKYWDGQVWKQDINKSSAITNQASNELSVTLLPDGRYAMVFQINGISNKVGLRLGAKPEGPFGPIIEIWDCSKDLLTKNLFAYNAKAHPALSKNNELLISYNINSFDFLNDLKTHPQLYRPRFIKVKIED